MDLDYEKIGLRIKEARLIKKLTQEQLAEKVGVTVNHISNVERAWTSVSLSTLVKIANVLEVSADDLLCDNLKKSRPVFEKELAKLIHDCNDYELRVLIDIFKASKKSVRENSQILYRIKNED